MHDGRLEPTMQMRREPPVWPERAQEAHHGRGAERALVDVVAEVRLPTEEAAQVAVVFDTLRPVVREEDCRGGELHARSARRNDKDEGGEAHEGEADDVVLADVVNAAHRAVVVRDTLVVAYECM